MGKNKKKLTLKVIAKAISGDVKAIHSVLDSYMGYIRKLSTQRLYDNNGNVYYVVDEHLRRHLETSLIVKILKFKIS
jgi:hypothetical protein